MFLNDIIKNFFPKDKIFYELFDKVVDNALTMGNLLDEMVSHADIDTVSGATHVLLLS